jgi:putative drug exporter of the RND superfamily
MDKFSRFVLGHKRLVVLLWLAVLVAGAAAAPRVPGRLSQEFSVPGQPGFAANQAILHAYGNGGSSFPLVPVLTAPAGVSATSPQARRPIGSAFGALARVPGLRVVSYASTGDRRFVPAGGRVTFGLVFAPQRPGFAGNSALAPKIAQVMRRGLPAGWSVRVTGLNALESAGSSGNGPGVLTETLLGGVGALAVLVFVFGSLLALVPLLVAAVSIVATFLLILGLTEFTQVSFIVQFLVALIGLGVAIDYSLLLVTRWREQLAQGMTAEEAVARAMPAAGRAVAFSGLTVAIGLVSMVFIPVPFLRSIGYGGMLIPLVSVAAALTLLPVLLATAGPRLDRHRLRKDAHPGRGWTAWAKGVTRHRWAAVTAAALVLVPLGLAAAGLQLGTARANALAHSGPAYQGLVRLETAGVPAGILTPLEILVPPGVTAEGVAAGLRRVPGVWNAVAPASPSWHRGGSSLVMVEPAAELGTPAGKDIVASVRAAVANRWPRVRVGGAGVEDLDFTHAVYGHFPLMLAVIALVTFVLLARAFRSLLLPAKAVVLNLVSVAAAYGVLVLVWQEGHGSGLWGIPATGAIDTWIPLMVFAFLYGLSMDYEVFILSRMREEHDQSGSTARAVEQGIGRTGRLVTSAALILFLAFASLASGPETAVKVFATALGAGILLDATVVRALLVPALVSLFGRWNWWLPAPAARLLRVQPSPARAEDQAVPGIPVPTLADARM